MFDAIFYILSILAIGGAIGIILFAHPLYSAFCFLLTLLSIAGFYALLNLKLLFAMQIIVYAGAIMVLIIFIMMYLNIKKQDIIKDKLLGVSVLISAIVLAPIAYVSVAVLQTYMVLSPPVILPEFGSVKNMGLSVFVDLPLQFELVSILLLLVAVGVILVLKKDKK